MSSSAQNYPRPDFRRSKLQWQSLNGPWDFIFDDGDVGLDQGWQHEGLPESIVLNTSGDAKQKADTITQKIAALPENLLQDNVFQKSVDVKKHEKQKIEVPFVFQTPASGINERGAHEVIWYEREIKDIRESDKPRLLLRFGAVDYDASVWIDGHYTGSHRGGHVPFELDISDAVRASTGSSRNARLTIRVRDSPCDLTQPRGKQYWAPQPESIFYTPSSGIWQSVWIESVPRTRIGDGSHGTLLRSNDISAGELHATIAVVGRRSGQKCRVEVEASFEGVTGKKSSGELSRENDYVKLDLNLRLSSEQLQSLPKASLQLVDNPQCWKNGLALWSPEHPLVYDITLKLYDPSDELVDEVKTIAGMRSLDWEKGDGTFRLNGKPYFQALVLDQGYWPNTGMTPPTSDSCKADIEMSKAMGFNGCRKHQKVEDPLFLYWADRLGYLVWGEMANAYQFNQEYVERFNQEWVESMKRDINHPCIVAWTPVNESWGYPNLKDDIDQRNHIRQLYYMTKNLDPTRPVNDNCGWEHVCTDLTTFHDYSDAPELTQTSATMNGILDKKAGRNMFTAPIYSAASSVIDSGAAHKSGAPVLCTEFGGVNIAPAKDDASAGERDWGYTTADDPEDLRKRIEGLVLGIVQGGHCCGFVYTQLSDIEQETNGVYSFDRRAKLDPSKVKAIMDKAQALFYEQHR